ncbi:serine carboxypeptidase [Aureococcus anophagefferens]|nr:serine carboxypeptidase [Aureococcus anophagefferens]
MDRAFVLALLPCYAFAAKEMDRAFVLALLPCYAFAAPASDAVPKLPGWDKPLPSKVYSGFVDVSAAMGMDMKVHYLYHERGRPGQGPDHPVDERRPRRVVDVRRLRRARALVLDERSTRTAAFEKTGVPSLFYNEYGWTQLGSVLMFDWPPPVGFSQCGDDPAGDGTRIYVPKLVERILDDDAPTVRPQLKGFAVGDGCAGTEVLCGPVHVPWYKVIFFYGHGQVSNLLFDDIMDTCGMAYLRRGGAAPPGCQLLLDEIDTQTLWVNASSVRDALHVPAPRFNGDNGVGMNYSSTEANVLPIYRRGGRGLDGAPRLRDDADLAALDARRQARGRLRDARSDFLTIRGSGHGPQFKPAAARVRRAWLDDADYATTRPALRRRSSAREAGDDWLKA